MSAIAQAVHALARALDGIAAQFDRLAQASYPAHVEAEEELLNQRNRLSRYY